jgi:hypothetical protein
MCEITALLAPTEAASSPVLVRIDSDGLGSYCDPIGGWVESVTGWLHNQPVYLFHDEDALAKGHGVNAAATSLWHSLSRGQQYRRLFGPVLVVGHGGIVDGERSRYGDVPESVVHRFRALCS